MATKSKIYNYSSEELQQFLDESNSYREVLTKIGLGLRGKNTDTLKKVIKEFGLDETKLNINRHKMYQDCAYKTHFKTKKSLEEILQKNTKFQGTKLLERLFDSGLKQKVCEECGITEWNNKPITLQIHHKDGDITNNELTNLGVLCPNCHSQTDNYAGKATKGKRRSNTKSKSIRKRELCPICNNNYKVLSAKCCIDCYKTTRRQNFPPKKDLEELVNKYPLYKVCKYYNVSDKTIAKWCKYYNITYNIKQRKHIIAD